MDNKTTAIIRQLEGDAPVGVFQDLLRGTPAEQTAVKLALRQNPRAGLLAIQTELEKDADKRKLTWRGAADSFEAILEQVGVAEARALPREVFSAEQLNALLVERGDRPSTSTYVVAPRDILAAMMGDIKELGEDRLAACLHIRSWATTLKDRDDYAELLKYRVYERWTLRECILIAISLEGRGRNLDEPTSDLFEDVGLDYEESLATLGRMNRRLFPKFSKNRLEEARRRLMKRRKQKDEAPSFADEVRDRGTAADDDLQIG